jgi:hypothetical protein
VDGFVAGRLPETRAACAPSPKRVAIAVRLRVANDLGGALTEEMISRMASSGHGSATTVVELTDIAAGRPVL